MGERLSHPPIHEADQVHRSYLEHMLQVRFLPARDTDIESRRRDVYEALLQLRSGGVGSAVASFDTLAAVSGRSRLLVVSAVADLVSAGLVVHHPPLKDPQRQSPSCYEVRVLATR